MKKKLLLAILTLLILLLIIIFILMAVIGKNEPKSNISQEELTEIEVKLRQTSFLNCIYNSPEEIDIYYVLMSCKEEETKTERDDAEYIYLSSLNSENYSLDLLYPDIMKQTNLTSNQKKQRIIQEIIKQLREENAENAQIAEDEENLGIATLSYKKINYNTAKNILQKNISLSEEKIDEILNNLKNSSKLFYSDEYDCFYIGTSNKNVNAYDYNLKCISGIYDDNKYVVRYTLQLQNATKTDIEFEVSFYENNGLKFISNNCITTEEMQAKAEEFEESIEGLRTVTDDNGNIYGYVISNSKDGLEYEIENGRNKAYYKLCFAKTKTSRYYFTQDVYFYFNDTESNNTFLGCYPRQVMTYDFTWINDNFSKIIANTII